MGGQLIASGNSQETTDNRVSSISVNTKSFILHRAELMSGVQHVLIFIVKFTLPYPADVSDRVSFISK